MATLRQHTNDSRNAAPDQHPRSHLITMRPNLSRPHSATQSTLHVHPPAWRENRSNRGNPISLSKPSTAPKPRHALPKPHIYTISLACLPRDSARNSPRARLSSRSFPLILLQFRLRADHRRLRMSTGGLPSFAIQLIR